MASTNENQLPPWLAYVIREAHFDSLSGDYEEQLVALLSEKGNMSGDEIVALLKEHHLVIAIPKGGNNEVAFVHNVAPAASVYANDRAFDKSQGFFLGMCGFAGTAPLKMLREDVFDAVLATKVRVTKQLAEVKVPSLEAMIKAYQDKENIVDIRSDEGVSVQKWRDRPLVQVWDPQLLEKVEGVHEHSVEPLAIITGVIKEILERVEKGLGLVEPPLLNYWEDNLKALWVKAFINNSNGVEVMEPFAGQGADEYNQKLFRRGLFIEHEAKDGSVKEATNERLDDSGETVVGKEQSLEEMIREATRTITEGVMTNVAGFKRRQERNDLGGDRAPKRASARVGGDGEPPVRLDEAGLADTLYEAGREPRDNEGSGSTAIMTLLNENMRMMREVVQGASKTNEGMLRAFTSVLTESLDMRRQEQAEKKKEKQGESLLGDWTEKDKKLFELLSATNWDQEGVPELNKFAKSLVTGKRKVTRGIRLIQLEAEERHWQGAVITSGLSKFLREGFRAEDIVEAPGGISPFSCQPASFVSVRTAEEEKQFMQDNFGNGKLNDEVLDALAKKVWFIPSSMLEATDMIETLIGLLDLLTNTNSIASEGYRFGLTTMKKHKRMFAIAEQKDKMFWVKFIYLMDTTFQGFCKRLVTYADREHPIQDAARRLEGYQAESIYEAIQKTVAHGVVPADLPVPLLFQRGIAAEEGELMGADPWGRAKGSKMVTNPGAGDNKEGTKHPDWFKKNPNPEGAWELPAGETFGSVFGGEVGKENQKGFPKFKHHQTGKSAFICLAYQVKGNCKRGASCFNAHVPPPKMKEAEKKKVAERLREVYMKG